MAGEIGNAREGHSGLNIKFYDVSWIDYNLTNDSQKNLQLHHEGFLKVQEWFLDEATLMAKRFGYSGTITEGKNHGWLVPYYGDDEDKNFPDLGDPLELIKMQAWANAVRAILWPEIVPELEEEMRRINESL